MSDKLQELRKLKTFPSILSYIEENPEICFNSDVLSPSIKFTYLDITFGKIPNTHHCPHNGVKNWSGSRDLPLYYWGWRGKIEFITHSSNNQRANLHTLRIFTGTGGARSRSMYGYDVIFFASDWMNVSEEMTFPILCGNEKISHSFKFGKPDYFA